MVKESMGRWLNHIPLSIVLGGILTLAGCGKSGSNRAIPVTPLTSETTTPDAPLSAPCSVTVKTILDEITRAENEKSALEVKAKGTPEKTSFKKLYDAETAFVGTLESKTARLVECKVSGATIDGLKTKLEKSRANLLYLRESFPDFK